MSRELRLVEWPFVIEGRVNLDVVIGNAVLLDPGY